jgi:hypothetical protein
VVCLFSEFGMNTKRHKGLYWFRPPERNTLPPLCVSSIECVERVIEFVPCNVVCLPFYSLREAHTRMLSPDMRA